MEVNVPPLRFITPVAPVAKPTNTALPPVAAVIEPPLWLKTANWFEAPSVNALPVVTVPPLNVKAAYCPLLSPSRMRLLEVSVPELISMKPWAPVAVAMDKVVPSISLTVPPEI